MRINAQNVFKRFGLRWVVHDFSVDLKSGSKTAILGPNGSGKSTLLKILASQLLPSKGNLQYSIQGQTIAESERYKTISLCGPYLELIEELSAEELAKLHCKLRGFHSELQVEQLWEQVKWPKRIYKQSIASYSSGMKQRLRLLLALATKSQALFLDEPSSNLDVEGVDWYHQTLEKWLDGRTVVIASNEERDFLANALRIKHENWKK